MQGNRQQQEIAKIFLEVARNYLEQAKKDFGTAMDVVIPLSQADYDRTIDAFESIKELAKQDRIVVMVNDESESLEEYGHTRCFKISEAV